MMTGVVLIVLGVVSSPFLIYLCIKLGRYAYLEGQRAFERDNPKE